MTRPIAVSGWMHPAALAASNSTRHCYLRPIGNDCSLLFLMVWFISFFVVFFVIVATVRQFDIKNRPLNYNERIQKEATNASSREKGGGGQKKRCSLFFRPLQKSIEHRRIDAQSTPPVPYSSPSFFSLRRIVMIDFGRWFFLLSSPANVSRLTRKGKSPTPGRSVADIELWSRTNSSAISFKV